VPEIIGSGPFIFVKDEWVPGSKVIYVKNPNYAPRAEAPSFLSGAKLAKVDRVEWHYIPDAATAMNALLAGEIDYFELPPHDLLPIMEASPGVLVENLNPLGFQGWLRLNHTLPPFDDPKLREAVLWMVNQADYLQATIGNPSYYTTCGAYFGCNTPLESKVGSQALMTQDLDKARALVSDSGYDGTPVVVLQATDIAINNGLSLVTAQMFREIGFTVELQAMDWSTLTSRRAISEPTDQGGWNAFHTWWTGADILNPVANIGVSGGCRERAWFGWPCDEEIENMRDDYARASDLAEQMRLAEAIQQRAYEQVTYVPLGQWFQPRAYRDHLSGLLKAPVPLFWNIEKQ